MKLTAEQKITIGKVLVKAQELIQNSWCRDSYARDKNKDGIDPKSPAAVSFCAVGAVTAATKMLGIKNSKTKAFLREALHRHYPQHKSSNDSVEEFNDSKRNKRDVLRLFRLAVNDLS